MRSIKKLVIISLIMTVLLAGCSSKNSSKSNQGNGDGVIKLNYWVPFSGSDGEFMQDMVKKFNDSQDEIQVKFMNNNWDDYYTKLKTSLVSNTGPDVAISHISHLSELIPTGKLEQLDDLATEAGVDWSSFGKNQVDAGIRDGKHYAIPIDTHALVMFYNKKYLKDAGLLNDDGTIKMDQSPEGFTKMLKTLKAKLPKDVSPMIVGSNNVFTFWIWYALVHQQGGTYIEDGKATINTAESKEAMKLLKTWLDEGLILPDIGDNSYDIFKTEKAAVTFTGVWATGNFESNTSLDFAAASFPKIFDQPAAWGDSHTIILPKQDNKEKKVAAMKFADWIAENGVMWAKAGHVPTKKSVVDSEEYKNMPYRSDYAEVMNIVKYMPDTDKLAAVNDAVLESLVKINYGQLSIDEGLKEAQEKADKLLNK